MVDFKVGDIIKYTGKSISSITKDKNYIIFKKGIIPNNQYSTIKHINVVYYLDNKGKEKMIVLNDNKWQSKFVYVSNIRKEKLKKISENL